MNKLTISVDGTVVDRAKRYAKAQRTSLSKLIERYLRSLVASPPDCPGAFFAEFHQQLLKEGYTSFNVGSDDDIRRKHIRKKYLEHGRT